MGGSGPTYPVLIQDMDYIAGGMAWCNDGYMIVGAGIEDVIEME